MADVIKIEWLTKLVKDLTSRSETLTLQSELVEYEYTSYAEGELEINVGVSDLQLVPSGKFIVAASGTPFIVKIGSALGEVITTKLFAWHGDTNTSFYFTNPDPTNDIKVVFAIATDE